MSDSSQNQRPSHTKPVSPRTTSGLQERDEDSERAAPHRAPRSPATGPHSPGPGKQALTSGPLSRRGPASTEQPKLAGSHAGNQDAVSGDNRPQGCPSPCKHPTGSKLARQPGRGPPPNRLPAQHGGGGGGGGAAPQQPEETLGTSKGHPVGTAAPGARGGRTREAGCAHSTLGERSRRAVHTRAQEQQPRGLHPRAQSHQQDPALIPAHGPRPTAPSQAASSESRPRRPSLVPQESCVPASTLMHRHTCAHTRVHEGAGGEGRQTRSNDSREVWADGAPGSLSSLSPCNSSVSLKLSPNESFFTKIKKLVRWERALCYRPS